ncbi:hypothetical protein B4U80_14731, partial [Leptotrombidium deliense]
KDRDDNFGGVLIAVKNEIPTVQLDTSFAIEHVAVRIKTNNTQLLLICIYLPPLINHNTLSLLKLFLNEIQNVKLQHEELIIVGDFNVNILKHNSLSGKFRDMFALQGLKQLIKEPTFPQQQNN